MLAQLPDVGHLVDSAVTYSYAGLFDGPGDVGVLNLVALQTRHTYNVLEGENGHCGTPCRTRGGNEDTRGHAGHRRGAAKSVQAGGKAENDQSGEQPPEGQIEVNRLEVRKIMSPQDDFTMYTILGLIVKSLARHN
jgi:hypothetical protein